MTRVFLLLALLLSVVATGSESTTVFAQGSNGRCFTEHSVPGGCRTFISEERMSDWSSVMVFTEHYSSPEEAESHFESTISQMRTEVPLAEVREIPSTQGLYVAYWLEPEHYYSNDYKTAVAVILDGDVIVVWSYQGYKLLIQSSWVTTIHGYARERYPSGKDQFLPTSLEWEEEGGTARQVSESFYGWEDQPDTRVDGNEVKRMNLITRSDGTAPPAEPTPAPTQRPQTSNTSSSSTTSSSNSGPVKLLSISSKDAGIGDGTIYVYVEVQNTSGRSLNYVHVDLACLDSSDRVIGTGIANIAGLAPGDTAVLTGIILQARGCETISAKVNPLTN